MAETLKNARSNLTTDYQTLYTCPTGNSAMVVSLLCANIDSNNNRAVTASWKDSSDSNTVTVFSNEITVPVKSTLSLLDKTSSLGLEAGDSIQLLASANGTVHVSAVIVEIS